jgi:hypothetical protein
MEHQLYRRVSFFELILEPSSHKFLLLVLRVFRPVALNLTGDMTTDPWGRTFSVTSFCDRSCDNVLAEMLEKVLAYNISQIVRVRKKLSEREETQRAAA